MLGHFCFLAVILSVTFASAPFIKPCKLDDNACVVASAKAAVPFFAAGVPELGMKPLDPMKLDQINGDQGGLQLTFKNTVVNGMKGCFFDEIKFNQAKSRLTVTLRCSVDLSGDYKLGGRLLVLPIEGEGKYNIQIRDIIIKTINDLVKVQGDDGKQHWHIDKWRHTYQVKTSTKFHFDNLFNGNKVLAEPVLQFTNTNWRDVMQEVAPPIVKAIVAGVVDNVEALYKAIPTDELYIE